MIIYIRLTERSFFVTMRTTNGNQKILVLQQKHTYLNCILSPPTEKRQKLLALLKVRDEQRCLEPSVSEMEAMCETSLPGSASAPDSQPVPCLLLWSWAGCQPCCSFVLRKTMVFWCKWRSTENHCTDLAPDHLHHFFLLWDLGSPWWKNVFIFTMTALGDYDKAPASLQRSPV